MAEDFVIRTRTLMVQGLFIFSWENHLEIPSIVDSKPLIKGSNLIRKSTC